MDEINLKNIEVANPECFSEIPNLKSMVVRVVGITPLVPKNNSRIVLCVDRGNPDLLKGVYCTV